VKIERELYLLTVLSIRRARESLDTTLPKPLANTSDRLQAAAAAAAAAGRRRDPRRFLG